jgi:hypothetical protein
MSWIEKVQNGLIITTGDSKKYYPAWLNANKGKEFNISEFEFDGQDGTLVKRNRPKGNRYSLEIYFDGADHLDTAKAFDKSADDTRAWVIEHPYYGSIIVQPVSLQLDNSAHNVSKYIIPVIETIVEDFPKVKADPIELIKLKKGELDTSFATTLNAKVKPADISLTAAKTNKNFKLAVPVMKVPEQFQAYNNLFNIATTAINNATQSPIIAMRETIALINYPVTFSQNVKSRVDLLKQQFETYRETLGNLGVAGKQIYQNLAGSVVSAMVLASINPFTGDYKNNTAVYAIIDIVVNAYNTYLDDLDKLQSDNGNNPLSFIPDANSLILLNGLFYSGISNLFLIAFTARKERSILCEKDTNLILLTHRFYGLDADDNNIAELMETNNMGLNQILQIKKGSKIIYYV